MPTEGGTDLIAVQEMLGHADISTTQIYTPRGPQLSAPDPQVLSPAGVKDVDERQIDMDSVRVRRWWRVWFYAAVAIVAPFTVPSALDIPDAERIAVISGWVAAALLYAALVWRTWPDGRDWWVMDALIILMFLLAALYQANWPNWRIPSNPALVGGLCAASALGSSIRQARQWQPPERPAPQS